VIRPLPGEGPRPIQAWTARCGVDASGPPGAPGAVLRSAPRPFLLPATLGDVPLDQRGKIERGMLIPIEEQATPLAGEGSDPRPQCEFTAPLDEQVIEEEYHRSSDLKVSAIPVGFIGEPVADLTESGIGDRPGQPAMTDHPRYVEAFHHDRAVFGGRARGELVNRIPAQMCGAVIDPVTGGVGPAPPVRRLRPGPARRFDSNRGNPVRRSWRVPACEPDQFANAAASWVSGSTGLRRTLRPPRCNLALDPVRRFVRNDYIDQDNDRVSSLPATPQERSGCRWSRSSAPAQTDTPG
jgi:hypothetical protein